jgi:deoxyribose-phosphate aldolase
MYSFSLLAGIPFASIPEETRRIMQLAAGIGEVNEPLRRVFSCMDYTSLDGTDNTARITTLCRNAMAFAEKGLPYPAAVCIYPPFVALAKELLRGTPIRVATTAAAFPSGQMALPVKLEEIRYAVGEGADEVDVVISRGIMLAGDYNQVFRELDAMRDLTAGLTLKVILETGELIAPETIAMASEIAIEAGADFIKTSTGKVSPAATEEAVFVMLHVIREFHRRGGRKIGIKPAGGIADCAKALNYYSLVREILGEEWLDPDLFRIGASRLADRIIERLAP